MNINGMIFTLRQKISLFFSRFRKSREIFYINGPETLPPPLSREEENEIILRLESDESARQILIEHNLRLVVYIAKRFENTGTGLEDLISIGTIGLVKAINTFRAEKNIKQFLKSYRRHALCIIMILAAIITPSGDPFTLMICTVPMYLLYEFSVLICKEKVIEPLEEVEE